MKNKILLTVLMVSTFNVFAQKDTTKKQQSPLEMGTWYKKAPTSGSFGIDLMGAKNLVKGKKIIKAPIVAVIGTGADIEHEALKKSLWINAKEKADGIDNDGNGLVDDVNGWNFLGSKDGYSMEHTLSEGNREWLRLKDKYADLITDGKVFFVYQDGVRKMVNKPINAEEYAYFKTLTADGMLGGNYKSYQLSHIIKEYVDKWDKEIMAKFSGKTRSEILVKEAIDVVYDETKKNDSLATSARTFATLYGGMYQGSMRQIDTNFVSSWETVYKRFSNEQIQYTFALYEKALKSYGNDERNIIVGDDPNNLANTKYGNNQLLTPASALGTMITGIIAGQDAGTTGFSGIMPEAKIMNLVISAQSGNPYPKDMALAIRYAVNNGADIILLPQQSKYYSTEQKKWIDDALILAETKGILVITPVWEAAENMDNVIYFPSSRLQNGKKLNNFLPVGNSDEKGNPSKMVNYGAKQLDMFVPGVGFYAPMPGDIYKYANSPSFGAAVTAGSAAFIKAYFPKLTAVQIKKLLNDNVTNRSNEEIEKTVIKDGKHVVDLFLFSQLCASGGILNLKNSVEAALKIKK